MSQEPDRPLLTSGELSELRQFGQTEQAWTALNDALRFDPHSREGGNRWLEHVAGRYGDEPAHAQAKHFAAGCLLWEHVRGQLRQHPQVLPRLWKELVAAERTWLDAAAACCPDSARPLLHRPGSPLENVRELIRGGFAACRCAVAAALEASGRSPRDGRFLPGCSAWQEMAAALTAYERCWNGDAPAWENPWPAGHEPLELQPPYDAARLLSLLAAGWAVFQQRGGRAAPPRFGRPIALGMLHRALAWLLSDSATTKTVAEARSIWVLLAGERVGTCARLVLEPASAGPLGLLVFPDPIALGLVALDAHWRDAFDDAAVWARSLSKADARPWCWRLEFMEPRFAKEVSRRAAATTFTALQRPAYLEGGSASAALGALFASVAQNTSWDPRVAVTGRGSSAGSVFQVGQLWEKLDPALWHVFLGTQVDRLVTPAEDHDLARSWLAGMTRIADGKLTLHPVQNLEQTLEVISGRRRVAEAYARAQIKLAAERLRVVRPQRLERALHEADFDLFVELHVPLRCRIEEGYLGLAASAAVRDNDPHESWEGSSRAKPGRIAREADFADEFARWLADEQAPKALYVTAGPGMGKTWLGLQTAARQFSAFLDCMAPPTLLPLWVTCGELENGEALGTTEAESLQHPPCDDAAVGALIRTLAGLVTRRLDGRALEACGAARLVWEMALEARLLVIVDGWDERTARNRRPGWLDAIGQIGRTVLFSRGTAAEPQTALTWQYWSLAALGPAPEEFGAFVVKWFGADCPRGLRLREQLEQLGALRPLLRTPLMAAVICYLWEHERRLEQGLRAAGMPAVPPRLPDDETGLLRLLICSYLLEAGRPAAASGASDEQPELDPRLVEEELLFPLAKRALQDFTGDRWLIDQTAFARHFDQRLAGAFGLFFYNPDLGGYEIIHQSLVEWLVALALLRQFKPSDRAPFDRAAFAVFVEREQLRLVAPWWREVWAFLVGMAGDDAIAVVERCLQRLGWNDGNYAESDYLVYRDFRTLCRCLSQRRTQPELSGVARSDSLVHHALGLWGSNPWLTNDLFDLLARDAACAATWWKTAASRFDSARTSEQGCVITGLLAVLAPNLSADDTQAAFGWVGERLVAQANPDVRSGLADVSAALAPRLDSKAIEASLPWLSERIAGENDYAARSSLSIALASCASRSSPLAVLAAFAQILERAAAREAAGERERLVALAVALAPGLTASVAHAALHEIWVRLVRADALDRLVYADMLAGVVRRLERHAARTAVVWCRSRWQRERDLPARLSLADALAGLVPALNVSDVQKLWHWADESMEAEHDLETKGSLARVMIALAPRVDERAATAAFNAAVACLDREPALGLQRCLIRLLAALAPLLPAGETRTAFAWTTESLGRTTDLESRSNLAAVLVGIVKRPDAGLRDSLFSWTQRCLESDCRARGARDAAAVLGALAPHLSPAEAASAFERTTRCLESDNDFSSGRALALLATRLQPTELREAFEQIIERQPRAPNGLVGNAFLVAALASRLSREDLIAWLPRLFGLPREALQQVSLAHGLLILRDGRAVSLPTTPLTPAAGQIA